MAVTNAISGTTALGGMHLVAHSNSAAVTALGAAATTLSTVNIVGGFIVSGKMLDMFKRPDDPPEYYHYYGVPAAATMAMYGGAHMAGYPQVDSAAGTLAGMLCIGGETQRGTEQIFSPSLTPRIHARRRNRWVG